MNAATPEAPAGTLEALKAAATAHHAQWEHYNGHFDDHVAVRCTRDVKHRGETICVKGRWYLADPRSGETAEHRYAGLDMPKYLAGKTFVTIWTPVSGHNVSVRADYFDLAGNTINDRYAETDA